MPGSKTNNEAQEFKLKMEREEDAMEEMSHARKQNIEQNHLQPKQKEVFGAKEKEKLEEQDRLAADSWRNRKDIAKKNAILESFEKSTGVYFNVMPDETKQDLYRFAWNQLNKEEQLEATSDFEAAKNYFRNSPFEKNAENFFGKEDLEKIRFAAKWQEGSKTQPSTPKSKTQISEAERAKLTIAEQWKL